MQPKTGFPSPLLLLPVALFFFLTAAVGCLPADRLTDQERSWLRRNPTIVFVSQSSYPPFEFVSVQGRQSGMCIELVRWMGTELGFTPRFTHASFARAREAVLGGQADVITSFFYSRQRDKTFDFTGVMFAVPASIFVVADCTDIHGVADLAGRRVAVQEGDYALEFLAKKGIDVQPVLTENFGQATDAVLAGRAAAVIGDEPIVLYHFHATEVSHPLKIVGDPLYTGQNCMAVREGRPVLLSILNKGVERARRNGVLERIENKWLGTRPDISAHRFFPYLVLAAAGLLLCGLLIWLSNLGLRKLVRERTRALAESEENLRITLDSIGDAVMVLDLSGRIVRMNPVAESLTGWPLREAVGKPVSAVFHIVNSRTRQLCPSPAEKVLTSDDKTKLVQETLLIARDGREYQIADSAAPIRSADGKTTGVVLVFRDVTEECRIQNELEESEKRYRTIVEESPIGIFYYNDRGVIVDVNKKFVDIIGSSREALIGLDMPNRLNNREIVEAVSRSLAGESAAYEGWYASITADKTSFVRCLFQGLRDKDEVITAGMGLIEDITERQQAVDALRHSEENLRITLNSIGDGVIATDLEERVVHMNPVAEELTGWPTEEAAGRPITEVFHIINSQIRGPVESPVTKVLAEGAIIGLANHTVLISRDGREYQIADSGAPIRNAAGKITGVVLVFRDVTEKYELEDRFRQMQKMEAIGQLAGGVAHDFNNMIGGIRGAAELLSSGELDEEKTQMFLSMIIDSADQAAGLAQKLLSFSRRKPVDNIPIDVHLVIENAVSIMRNTLDRRVNIKTDLTAVGSMVNGEEAQLQNVLLNLGINAGHAMPAGGMIHIHSENVELTAEYCQSSPFDLKPGPYLKLAVSDTGAGIPAADLPRIFEPFFTTKEQGKGTGLGLSAVYGTIRQHQGAIHVYSEESKGTCFHVLLPLTEDAAAALPASSEQMIPGQGTILLVDDEEIIRSTGRQMLQQLGYRVLLAENGRQALEVFAEHRQAIDLAILDMVMPEMNGRECFFALRQMAPEIPVLLSSGFTRDEDLQELEAAGLNGFVQKPYRTSELSRIIAEILGRVPEQK